MRQHLSLALAVVSLGLACAEARPSLKAKVDASSELPAHKKYAATLPVDVPLLRTAITPAELSAACLQAETDSDAKLAALVAQPDDRKSFASTFIAYEEAMADYGDAVGRLSFLKDIHPDAKVREAGAACEERAGKYMVQVGARKDLYLAMKAVLAKSSVLETLDPQDRRLAELTMRDFKRNGLELSEADRKKLVDLRQRLATLQTAYSHNLDENTDSVEATPAELAGLPADFLARLKKAPDGKLIVTTKYPDYFPVMENAKSEAVRKRLDDVFQEREAKANLPLLQEAVALRDQAAHLLGYASHADFVAEDRMAKDSKTVAAFLARLREELKGRLASDNAKMQALKAADVKDPKAVLQQWDWRYYLNQLKKRDFAIDDEKVRQYFPADKVLSGMFNVYATLFGVTFEEVVGAPAWAEGVKLYTIHDAQSKRLLAKFYVDLFPRDGKYGHAASFPIGVAREVASGYQLPLSALVVNFSPPEGGQVARLSFEEVDTLFHEFGHIMHQSLTTARYASQSGANVALDFVEAPSQMLENWVYQPEILKLVSVDPSDVTKTLPDDLLQRLAAARSFDSGVRYSRQVYLATFDQAIHSGGDKVDVDGTERALRAEILGWPVDAHEHSAASFGHLMGGYDAGYYGYLWSEVFSADMFTRFKTEGVLNPVTGREYRDIVLASGRTVEPMELLKRFLGRAPSEEAFLKQTGIKP